MDIKITTMEELSENSDKLSIAVSSDISKRINDWMGSGGQLEDPYIKQQFRYAERVINSQNKKES